MTSSPFPCVRVPRAMPVAVLGLLAAAALPAAAQEAAAPDGPFWHVSTETRAAHAFDADIDSGGSFDVSRAQGVLGLTYVTSPRDSVGIALDYTWSGYGFEGAAGLGALDPWGDLRKLSLSLPYRMALGERWDVLAIVGVASAAESGAAIDRGVTGSGLLAVSYRVSDSLALGPGFGIASQIDDDATVFPFLVLDWQVTPALSLTTRGDGPAVDGPQATLTWRPAPAWSLGLGAAWESKRYRLADDGPVPGGVGQNEAWPVYLSLAYGDPRAFQVYGFGGYRLGGELTVEDRDGVLAASSGYADAPFLGAGLRLAW
ncbi:MAG: hypothetical protein O2825_00110 [Proteobacteria bacterium]|nr:hypothetical protein [Pseudomonadota bacterium]